MGLLLCKKCICCCFCNLKCCTCCKRNSVDVLPPKNFKVLILGLKGSGKTELGHFIADKKRLDTESTNGVKFFSKNIKGGQLSIVDIGGNDEMIKLWPHYFVSAMALIYCYDLSSYYEDMEESFSLLAKVLSHPFVQAKPLLIVGTKEDQADEGLQLYDVDNTFFLSAMADYFSSSSLMISYDSESPLGKTKIQEGLDWLLQQMTENYENLKTRLKGDKNLKTWMEKTDELINTGEMHPERYRRFYRNRQSFRERFARITNSGRRLGYRLRPRTAPSSIYTISYTTNSASEFAASNKICSHSVEEHPSTIEDFSAQADQCSPVSEESCRKVKHFCTGVEEIDVDDDDDFDNVPNTSTQHLNGHATAI